MTYNDRRSALAGIVSTTLLTRHLLFVGFSLSDENFHLINSVVCKLLPHSAQKNATALQLSTNSLIMELNENIEIVSVTEPNANPHPSELGDAARSLEVLIDYLACITVSPVQHLMDPAFNPLLTDEERALREVLNDFHRRIPPALRASPYARRINELFFDFGARDTFSQFTKYE